MMKLSEKVSDLELLLQASKRMTKFYRDSCDELKEESDMLANENCNFAWHLECIGYADQTIDKIATGFHKEDDCE